MQLGARWQSGATPHRSVPPQLHAAIAECEAEHPAASAWTLTWLEGRPRCALDAILVLTIDASGTVVRESVTAGMPDVVDDDDDWLT